MAETLTGWLGGSGDLTRLKRWVIWGGVEYLGTPHMTFVDENVTMDLIVDAL